LGLLLKATIIARKREACAEQLNQLRNEYASYEKELKQIRSGGGDDDEEILRPEDVKKLKCEWFFESAS
jgi:hypothetical protein